MNMTLHFRTYLAVLLTVAALTGCDSLGENAGDEPTPRGVVIANQGNFGDGNGSVSTYDPESGMARAAVISSLGSIVQSIELTNDRLYVLSNTAGRIDVFDARSYERSAQITEVISPRYMLVDGTAGYVTSLYDGAGSFSGGLVTVLDLESNNKVDEIPVGDNPEGLALVGTRLYVANHGFGNGTTISVIETTTREVVDTIDAECDGPRFMAVDADSDVFVICTGRTIYNDSFEVIGETDGAVRILDGATGEIFGRIEMDGRLGTVGPGQDAYYSAQDGSVFVVHEEASVIVLDTRTNTRAETIGPVAGQPLSAVAFDGVSDRLYLGRSNGFTEAGEVSVHDRSGAELDRFTTGIVPTFIAFHSDAE